jgi:choline dehydrogenase
MPMSVNAEGRRNGARDMLLGAKERHADTLTLQDGARVSKIVLDANNKVTGVRYTDPQGKEHAIDVGKEAIVAAGALESAALLMRSGIGPKDELAKIPGVAPKVILDGVGKRQGFRYEVGVVVRMKQPLAALQKTPLPVSADDPAFKQWQAGKGGPLAINGAILSFQARSRPDLKEPDLFVFAVPGKFEGYEPGYSKEATADPRLLTFVVLNKNKGEANGTLQLDPNNPNGAPLIDEHFHGERRAGDSAPLVAGVKLVRDLVASQLGDVVESEVWPGADKRTDAEIAAKVEAESWDHHPRGGAQLGHANDPKAVVDSDFKVLGTTGLRVIDASVLPNNIGDFIVSGLYQIGKLAAQKIAADAGEAPKAAATFNPLSIRMADPPKSLGAAQAITQQSADAAEAKNMITPQQHAALTDGTVSQADMDLAWAAIDDVLARGEEKGGDAHTVAHNLLLSVGWQIDQQSKTRTRLEGVKDRLLHFLGRR